MNLYLLIFCLAFFGFLIDGAWRRKTRPATEEWCFMVYASLLLAIVCTVMAYPAVQVAGYLARVVGRWV